LTIHIDKDALERACKEIIETILYCLPNAFKGTVYRIGKPPHMIAKRVTSGIIDPERRRISWGLPERSDYNPPGKSWSAYRDEPGRPLEAMAWCVERQKSWTAESPKHDMRSVRLQVEGVWEDYHHMEPVLVRKEDLFLDNGPALPYPVTSEGKTLWEDSDYVVIAVIKIHFRPNTIKIGSPETRIIKKLSRSLGTELLSYQLRQQSLDAMRQLVEDKIKSCNLLADSLRNAITKSGLIFSLIKLELSSLRQQWEDLLLRQNPGKKGLKSDTVGALNRALDRVPGIPERTREELVSMHNQFLELFLPPEGGRNWVRMQIEERWEALIAERVRDENLVLEVRRLIDDLKRSLSLGKDPGALSGLNRIPKPLKQEWVDLLYADTDHLDMAFLNRLTRVLEEPALGLPFQKKTRKRLVHLQTLAEIMGRLEGDTNTVLREVLNGCDKDVICNDRFSRPPREKIEVLRL